jgi:hypothetical protein
MQAPVAEKSGSSRRSCPRPIRPAAHSYKCTSILRLHSPSRSTISSPPPLRNPKQWVQTALSSEREPLRFKKRLRRAPPRLTPRRSTQWFCPIRMSTELDYCGNCEVGSGRINFEFRYLKPDRRLHHIKKFNTS